MQSLARWLLAATALACAAPQARAADPLVIGFDIELTGGLADYLRSHTFHTIVGDITFGSNGEWTAPHVLAVQFQGVTGHDAEQFKDPKKEVILWPAEFRSGDVRYPYDDARK